jgi:micrococcal nuclease
VTQGSLRRRTPIWSGRFRTNYRRSWYDRYGRTLAYLDKAGGRDYAIEAGPAGAAHSYIYHNHSAERADEIAATEQDAKAAGRGLWGPPRFGATASVPR